jgi:hypothetical protein
VWPDQSAPAAAPVEDGLAAARRSYRSFFIARAAQTRAVARSPRPPENGGTLWHKKRGGRKKCATCAKCAMLSTGPPMAHFTHCGAEVAHKKGGGRKKCTNCGKLRPEASPNGH